MSHMDPTLARDIIERLNSSDGSRKITPQVSARFVLHSVGEDRENFPLFPPKLDDNATLLAYGFLAAGCALAEVGERTDGASVLERGASLLEYVHTHLDESDSASWHLLMAAMAFYAAGQYSRAFVITSRLSETSMVAGLVAAYIRKDHSQLVAGINRVLLSDEYSNASIESAFGVEEGSDETPEDRVFCVLVARALSLMLEYVFSGEQAWFDKAETVLSDAMELSLLEMSPPLWWIARLLRLLLSDYGESSPWVVLPPYFPNEGQSELTDFIHLLALRHRPVTELWRAQRAAIPKALDIDNNGAVISLRTSSGKTRVAEIAILQSLVANPDSKVLYLAPFRSLAFEVESSLNESLSKMGYYVSHIYGGARFSPLDRNLIDQAQVVIATPEKAKAMIRYAPVLWDSIKLVIIDEGHLLGFNDRHIRNEMFLEHLRVLSRRSGTRMLLLSAIIPNAQHIASWIAADKDCVAHSDWRPSGQRCGYLRWNGTRVRLDWVGEYESFNPSFVVAGPLGLNSRKKDFPADKNEAVAATAVRLSRSGSVLIFTGNAASVTGYAKATLLAMGEHPDAYEWPKREWELFQVACRECYGESSDELKAAEYGVLCHSAKLPDEVRYTMERLIHARPPKIVISTTTLAQGVNVGISSVIVANPWISGKEISVQDFWNVAGRAGRAFVDGEGKILLYVDEQFYMDKNGNERRKNKWRHEQLAEKYFDHDNIEPVQSGLLAAIRRIVEIATKAGFDFEQLLEMLAENDLSALDDKASEVADYCDLMDDTLLALHLLNTEDDSKDDSLDWVDDAFRESLAAIEAENLTTTLQFLRNRTHGAILAAGNRNQAWAICNSGLSLMAANHFGSHLPEIAQYAVDYMSGSTALEQIVAYFDQLVRESPCKDFKNVKWDESELAAVRVAWLSGVSMNGMMPLHKDAVEICRSHYGHQVTWAINGISRQLQSAGYIDEGKALETVSLLVELGLPSSHAANIYLAGIRSRKACQELMPFVLPIDTEPALIFISFSENTDHIRVAVSSETMIWVNALLQSWTMNIPTAVVDSFTLPKAKVVSPQLNIRSHCGQYYLCSPDYRERVRVKVNEKWPFDRLADNLRVYYTKNTDTGTWEQQVRDPEWRRYLEQ